MKNNKKLNGYMKMFALSAAFTLVFTAAGALARRKLELPKDSPVAAAMVYTLLGMFAVMVVMLIAGVIIKLRAKKTSKTAEEIRAGIMEQKDRIQADYAGARRNLHTTAVWLTVYEVYKCIFLCYFAFSIGFGTRNMVYIATFAVFLYYFARFFLRPKDNDYSNAQSEADYPAVYALARKAAKTLGVDNDIVIYINSNCSASVALNGDTVILIIGAALMDILDADELYNILRHEFAHVRNDSRPGRLENSIYDRLTALYDSTYYKNLTWFSRALDITFLKKYVYNVIFGSIVAEENADKVIPEFGDTYIAGKALAKSMYNDDFIREVPRYIDPGELYGGAEPVNNYLTLLVDLFREKLPLRADFWKKLHENELQPNVASHPLLRDRLAKLGLTLEDIEIKLPPRETIDAGNAGESEYRAECVKAVEYCDKRIFEQDKKSYFEDRRAKYLDPLGRVNEWVRDGRQLTPDTIKQICADLDALGRFDEEEAVCDRAMVEFGDEKKDHAYFIKGLCLLDKYDESGIDYLYKATDNPNYIDDVADVLGKYVCLLGLSERRDEYRQWGLDIMQQKMDKFDKMDGLSASDDLEPEPLEGTMLSDLLEYFLSIGEGKISRIFLLRKVITDDFFTSYFVIDFDEDTPASVEQTVMDKIFERLDTGYEWQFCLERYSRKFAAAIAKVPGSCVYDKEKGQGKG